MKKFITIFLVLLLSACQSNQSKNYSIDPPVPDNLVFSEKKGTELDYLLGTWAGKYHSPRRAAFKDIKFHVTKVWWSRKNPGAIELAAYYCWGTYPSRPYEPGCIKGTLSFEKGDDYSMARKIGISLVDINGQKDENVIYVLYESTADRTKMQKLASE